MREADGNRDKLKTASHPFLFRKMHSPQLFLITDRDATLSLVQKHSFATLFSQYAHMTKLRIIAILAIVITTLGARQCPAQAPDLPYLRLSNQEKGSLTTSHKGKILVIEFWATWCAPCQPAMAELQKTAAKFTDQKDKVEFLAISVDGVEDRAKVPAHTGKRSDLVDKTASHVKQKAWTHTINGWSSDDDLKNWPIRMVPLTFVIGADGKIIHVPGPQKIEDLIVSLLRP